MRLVIIIMIAGFVQVSAASFGQKLSYTKKDASLREIFKQITLQTGYNVLYSPEKVEASKKLNVDFKNIDLKAVLEKLSDESFVYSIEDKNIIIKPKEPSFLDRVVDAFTPPIDIRGAVLDEKGEPLIGVTIKHKGDNLGVSTGTDGKFSITVPDENTILVFSYIGFKSQELRAGNQSLVVTMQPEVSELQEVVVAYGKTTQQALTGSVTVVKGEQIESLPNRSFDKSLQGLVPGLQITQGTGQPGGGVSNMVLRGISTGGDAGFGSTVRNPLIVIDGVPVSQEAFRFTNTGNVTPFSNPLAQLNPSDIETISVLKDAAAIALYGSQASNGVILVTTKKGKSGKTNFHFRHQTDLSSRLKGAIEVLSQQEYLNMLYETFRNTTRVVGGVSIPWTDLEILAELKKNFPVRADGSFYPAPDWFGELFTNNATTVSNEAGMSGGSDKSNFYLNVEYTKQNGAVQKTGYDRKSMRFNFESRPISWLRLGTNTTLSYNIQNYSGESENALGFATGYAMSPLNPVRLEDGNYKLIYPFGSTNSTAPNAVAIAEYNINRNVAYRGLSKLYAELKLFKDFAFSSSLGVDFMLAEMKQKYDPRFLAASASATRPKIAEKDERRGNIINTNTFIYNKLFNDRHAINVLIGQEAQILTNKVLQAEATGTAVTLPYFDQLGSAGYTMSSISGSVSRQTLLSIFGQARYGYLNRYFVSGSIRKDGSSKFGDQSQWGTYWSTGLGWVLSEEKFLKEKVAWLDYFKLRGSIGAAGNSGAVSALTRFDLIGAAKFLGKDAFYPSLLGNPRIEWEETFTWDAGLELRLLKNRMSITADIYHKKTNGLIYTTNLPSTAGFGEVLDNIGDMENRGVELSVLGAVVQGKEFRWNLNVNWSSNQNKLTKANVPLASVSGSLMANEEGRNFNSYYLPIWLGVNPADGKPQWKDSNGNPTSTYGNAKKEFVGKPQPDGFGAINNTFGFKAFELSAQFYYQYGSKLYNGTGSSLLSDGRTPYANQLKQALDYWKKPGDITANPRRLLNNTSDGGNNVSTRYLFNGDYIRLQNVTIAYAFPKEILSHLHLAALRIFLQGNNLKVFTLFPGPDPDNANVIGSTAFAYPSQRSFSAGLNVNF
ncbi:MAG TPA: TonB-dependent receptor [Pedobacter sp.]|uniref:TonB-dependent receptor n=1 Tax=Pedobacter sp. TaxID=1411316 RepID=UPI002C6D8B20|nr:TonB-dependent receptor [Pedobacter sp.]HMI04007.1 TonB-dependent receptor [Pedobacter sp.]